MQSLSDERRKELIDNLVKNLPMIRAKLGLSQAELADRIGLKRLTISSAESGRSHLTFNSFVSLLMLFLYNDETRELVEMLGLFPADLQAFLMFK